MAEDVTQLPLPLVDFSDITDGCPQGDGIFDVLMKSVKAHLKEEYDAQRIRGSEYTQVYLGSLQSAMGQAIQWQLGAQIAANQALLIEKQWQNADRQNELLEQQRALLIAQTAQVIEQTKVTTKQIDQTEQQTSMIVAQTEGVTATNLNIPKQGDALDAEVINLGKQGLILDKQLLSIQEETKRIN